jgi:hypothetical protein
MAPSLLKGGLASLADPPAFVRAGVGNKTRAGMFAPKTRGPEGTNTSSKGRIEKVEAVDVYVAQSVTILILLTKLVSAL